MNGRRKSGQRIEAKLRQAIGYLRVSTNVQVRDGFGLDVQRASIEETSERIGAEIVAWCSDEGVSGTVEALDRPGFNCVVKHLTAGDADVVIVHHADRLARTLTVQEAALAVLWTHRATVYIGGDEVVADDPSDPIRTMVRQILGAVNEYARRDAMLKMHSGRKAIRRADPGRYIGGVPPVGCVVVDKRLVATPAFVEQIAAIRDGLASGLSPNAVAKNLGLHPQQISRRLATAERVSI